MANKYRLDLTHAELDLVLSAAGFVGALVNRDVAMAETFAERLLQYGFNDPAACESLLEQSLRLHEQAVKDEPHDEKPTSRLPRLDNN